MRLHVEYFVGVTITDDNKNLLGPAAGDPMSCLFSTSCLFTCCLCVMEYCEWQSRVHSPQSAGLFTPSNTELLTTTGASPPMVQISKMLNEPFQEIKVPVWPNPVPPGFGLMPDAA